MSKGGRESGQGEQRAVGGRGELGDSISLRRGGTTTTGRREREKFTNMHVGMRRRRGVHHTGGNQET